MRMGRSDRRLVVPPGVALTWVVKKGSSALRRKENQAASSTSDPPASRFSYAHDQRAPGAGKGIPLARGKIVRAAEGRPPLSSITGQNENATSSHRELRFMDETLAAQQVPDVKFEHCSGFSARTTWHLLRRSLSMYYLTGRWPAPSPRPTRSDMSARSPSPSRPPHRRLRSGRPGRQSQGQGGRPLDFRLERPRQAREPPWPSSPPAATPCRSPRNRFVVETAQEQ
jgi:hypothetical protein